ncbi:hypothetical protein AB4Y77_11615 [Paenarthrobacter sp. YAF11_1]|uniref:hypothetical protein n=1 Tax=Paenarthrobacter sp. YAF11_1 TaxID=3233074 RepID=UPI003F98D43A
MSSSTQTIEIIVHSRSALDKRLDDAVKALQEQALLGRTSGILLTRHSHQRYTAELSENVPFGLTRELH